MKKVTINLSDDTYEKLFKYTQEYKAAQFRTAEMFRKKGDIENANVCENIAARTDIESYIIKILLGKICNKETNYSGFSGRRRLIEELQQYMAIQRQDSIAYYEEEDDDPAGVLGNGLNSCSPEEADVLFMAKNNALVNLMTVYRIKIKEFIESHKNGKYSNLATNPKYDDIQKLLDSINTLREELNLPLLILENELEHYANIIYKP